MEVYDQFIDPTAVTHSVALHFSSLEKLDLVVVKNTLLQLFRVDGDKLVLQGEYPLQGQVIDISKVKLHGSDYDQLCVLTKFAKLSLVAFDHERNSISTSSLHYYEHEFQKRHINAISEASMRLDPGSRASLVFHRDMLALLPLTTDDDLDLDLGQGDGDSHFAPSIIIPSTKLDSSLHNMIDCQFLHNYREPTLAILHAQQHTWAADLSRVKDTMVLSVINLDLATGSSTPIISVTGLPYDTFKIVPLPQLGMVLVGCNQLIHVDNSGNCRGVSLNEYAKDCTEFKLEDRSQLEMYLEDCVTCVRGNQVFITDKNNSLSVLEIVKEGKRISLEVESVDVELPYGLPSTLEFIEEDLFVGSATANSVLLKNQTVSAPVEAKAVVEAKEKDDDDALYGDDDDEGEQVNGHVALEFKISDTLINHGSISSFTLGTLASEATVQGVENPNYKDTSVIAASGEGRSGKLTCFHPTIQPQIHSSLKFQNVNKSWSLIDKYLVTTDLANYKSEIFLSNDNFRTFQTLDFKNTSITVEIAAFESSKRIVQVTSTSVNLFDYTFKRVQQMNTDFEIVSATLLDPYIIFTSQQGQIKIFEVDSKGRKVSKIKIPQVIDDLILPYGTVAYSKLLSQTKRSNEGEEVEVENPVFLVVTVKNEIIAFTKIHNEVVYHLGDVSKFPEIVNVVPFQETNAVPDPFIKQIKLSKIGDSQYSSEMLTILTIGGEVVMYSLLSPHKLQKLDSNIFTGAPGNIYTRATALERKLIPLSVNDTQYIFITGLQPYVILKTRHSMPKIFKFTHTPLVSICQYEGKLMTIDPSQTARVCSIPHSERFDYSSNWPVEVYEVGKSINNVAYHETSDLLLVSTATEVPYYAKDEDGVDIVGSEEKHKAKTYKCSVMLIKPRDWIVLDEVEFPEDIVVNSLKTMQLTVSSRSKKKKELIVFGTGKYRLEDLAVVGEFHVYDAISIVPDPEKPLIDYKLKELGKEVVKGAVTAITEISGRFLVSQGPKIIIRDFQQDNSTVPVAFLDTPTYMSDAKSFENLLLVGDTLKNVWFLGFDAEPYRLLVLGKSLEGLNVSSCDFLVADGEATFLVADDEETLHLVAYDPDDVKSLAGQRLLQRTTFHINTLTTSMRMVSKHDEFTQGRRSFQVIGANTDGSLFKMAPIDEFSYRRLYILQQQMGDKLGHYLGLNPKANRFQNNDSGVKPVIDYELIRRFFLLNVDKRLQFSSKVGKNAYLEIWRDIIEIENSLNNLHTV